MAPKLDKGIMIGELVMNYPQSVEVLYAHGFHCIGCGLSAYETLEQGAAAHGFDEAQVEQIIAEIEEATKKAAETGPARKCEETGTEVKAGNKGGIIGKKTASLPIAASSRGKRKENRASR